MHKYAKRHANEYSVHVPTISRRRQRKLEMHDPSRDVSAKLVRAYIKRQDRALAMRLLRKYGSLDAAINAVERDKMRRIA